MPEFDRYIKRTPCQSRVKKNMQIYKIQCICHRTSLIRRQRIHGSDTSRKKDEEEIEEDMVLAEVDSGDDSTDIDLDSEKTDISSSR